MILRPDSSPAPRTGASVAGLSLFEHALQAGRTVAAPVPQNPCTPPADPPPEALRIRAILAARIGRYNAITAPQIAIAAGLWPDLRDADRGTKVRELITLWYESLLQPRLILVSTSAGYFHTDDPADLSRYAASLISRIREIAIRHRRLRLAAQAAGFRHHGHGHWSSP